MSSFSPVATVRRNRISKDGETLYVLCAGEYKDETKAVKADAPKIIRGVVLRAKTLNVVIGKKSLPGETSAEEIAADEKARYVPAFSSKFFKMFDKSEIPLDKRYPVGGIFKFHGVVTEKYVSLNDDGDRRVLRSYAVSVLEPHEKERLADFVEEAGFETTRFVPERDFKSPNDEYDVNAERAPIAVSLFGIDDRENVRPPLEELPPGKTRLTEDDWFPKQEIKKTWGFLVLPGDPTCFQHTLKDQTTIPALTGAGSGQQKEQAQFWIRQRDANGNYVKILAFTRFFNPDRDFQIPEWTEMAPYFYPHLRGTFVGTVDRKKTATVHNDSPDTFDHACYLFGSASFDVAETVKKIGVKVDGDALRKIFPRFENDAFVSERPDLSYDYHWTTAVGLNFFSGDASYFFKGAERGWIAFYVVFNHILEPEDLENLRSFSTEKLVLALKGERVDGIRTFLNQNKRIVRAYAVSTDPDVDIRDFVGARPRAAVLFMDEEENEENKRQRVDEEEGGNGERDVDVEDDVAETD